MMLGKVKSVDLVNPILESLISLCAGMSYAKAHVRARDLHPRIALCVCTSVETLFAGAHGAESFFSQPSSHSRIWMVFHVPLENVLVSTFLFCQSKYT